ncbi:hypothetical protein ACIOGZ_28895 [Kitasatospora sp. NPDC088160]|uniref:hypothetical protein n=1 Tax=Kitasatospora sp. NPDC088160 TaxID=3364072 RepID=UPI0038120144
MNSITSRTAETYLDSVDGALTAEGLRPAEFTVDDTDELADDSLTALPGAVLTWPAGHSKLDPERFPHGAVATWSAMAGWQAAALRPDGTSDTPTGLPLTALGEPNRVVEVITHVLLGRSAPEGVDGSERAPAEAVKFGQPPGGSDPSVDGDGPASDPALATLRAEIWGHFHGDPQGRAQDGRFASRLSFPLAGGGHSWSQHGVQITYGDTSTIADLDGYSDILEDIASQCPVIEGPLVLSL